MKRRHKLTAGLVAAVILAIALGAVGFAAARSGVLDYLFGASEPPRLAQENLVELGESVERNGITLTFDGYINDGAELSLVWTISSARDELVLVGTGWPKMSELLESRRMSSLIGYEEMAALGGERSGQTFEKSVQVSIPYDIPADLEGQSIDVTLTAKAYHSKVGYAPRNGEGGDTPAMFSAKGELLLSHGRTLAMTEVPQEALEAVAELSLSTTIQPPKSALHTTPVGQTEFDFDDYTLTVKKLDFGATRAQCAIEIVTKAPYGHPDENWFDDPLTGRNYRFVTDAGVDLWPTRIDPSGEQLPDGRLLITLSMEADPVAEIPKSVTIVPSFATSTDLNKHSDGIEQWFAYIKQNSIDAEAVTVALKQGELPASRRTKPTGETHFAYADCTIDLQKLNFADDRTVACFTLTTKEAIPEDEMQGEMHPRLNPFYALVDGDGNAIPGLREIRGEERYQRERQPDGTWRIQYQITWPAAEQVPEQVVLAPIAYPFADDAYGDLDQYTLEQMNDIYREHFVQDELMMIGIEAA